MLKNTTNLTAKELDAIRLVAEENYFSESEEQHLIDIADKLHARTPEILYIKATMLGLLGARSDEFDDNAIINGAAWEVEEIIGGKKCKATTEYSDGRLPENATPEQVSALVSDMNLEAAANMKIEEDDSYYDPEATIF